MSNKFDVLKGLVFSNVYANNGNDELIFECEDGRKWKFYHEQDCCEDVRISQIDGDLLDLVGAPLFKISEDISTSENGPCESMTATFYNFATVKGYVTVRWAGESNGYYSESVDFTAIT